MFLGIIYRFFWIMVLRFQLLNVPEDTVCIPSMPPSDPWRIINQQWRQGCAALRWRWYSKHHHGAHCYSKPKLSKSPSGISWAPYWSKPLKARRSLTRQALLHYLHTINISLQFCQVVIYRASVSSLCHLIWRQWPIYLCSSHMPLSEGHFISPQMLSVSCTFALRRFIFRPLFDLICPSMALFLF